MTDIIAFISIKGGVGKTTLALEVACSLVNDFNKKVLLVDANFSAPNIGIYLDLTNDLSLQDALLGTPVHNTIYESHGIDIIPASMYYKDPVDISKLSKILEKFKSRYDFIILDSSPNYEELKPVIDTADKIFVVTSPDHVTLETSIKAAQLAKEAKTPIEGIIVNKIRSPKHEYNLKQIEDYSDIPVVARINDNKEILAAMHARKPMIIHAPKNEISKEIKRLAAAISGEKESKDSFFSRLFLSNLMGKEKVNRELMRKRFYQSQLN
jgi:MinD-like ATPase involved in chromosome partitioning or flagellar assembly